MSVTGMDLRTGAGTGATAALEASAGEALLPRDAADLRPTVGRSQVTFSGKEPNILGGDNKPVTAVHEAMCAGTCDARAAVSGQINLGMQYLMVIGGLCKLKIDACVEGDLNVSAKRTGAVGGSLAVHLEATTKGVDIVDSDQDGGGFAQKTIIVSHTQEHPLKIVLGPGMNNLDSFALEIASGVTEIEGISVTATPHADIDVQDITANGARVVTLTRGRPPSA